MPDREIHPIFDNPPVVETILGVQFAPLGGFRSFHYGWFWKERLSPLGWEPVADEKPLPEYFEQFGVVKLKLQKDTDSVQNALRVRMRLKRDDRSRTLQLQPDKLYFSWTHKNGVRPGYTVARPEYDETYRLFDEFIQSAGIGPLQPTLWEVTYVNQVPIGTLWSDPNDWYRILPKYFPDKGLSGNGIRFATFDGHWHYEIEPERGRIHLRVAKVTVNQGNEPVLLVMVTSRGPVTPEFSWESGIEIGHRASVSLFAEVTSPEAQSFWGRRS